MTQFPQSTQPLARLAMNRRLPIHREVKDVATSEGVPATRGARRRHNATRDQLMAAAASVVWFAGWFQSIYDDIRGGESHD